MQRKHEKGVEGVIAHRNCAMEFWLEAKVFGAESSGNTTFCEISTLHATVIPLPRLKA